MLYRGVIVEFMPPLCKTAEEAPLPEAMAIQYYVDYGGRPPFKSISEQLDADTEDFRSQINSALDGDYDNDEKIRRLGVLAAAMLHRRTEIVLPG